MAALALGASAINMGTRFVATAEAPVHDAVKRQIVENDERATVLVFRKFRNTARVARNAVSEEIALRGARRGDLRRHRPSGLRGAAARACSADGDVDGGMWWAGQAQGLIADIPTCAELVTRIVEEAEELISARLPAMTTSPLPLPA